MEVGTAAQTGEATGVPSTTALPVRLLNLNEDIFNHLCSFVPVDDLLCCLAATSHAARRRVMGNDALWQQLWMQYVLHFLTSLVPPPAAAATRDNSTWTTAMVSAPACSDGAWRLYHYHASKEARPRVELLGRLTLSPEGVTDSAAVEVPKAARAALRTGSAAAAAPVRQNSEAGELRDQLLRFAQLCATQPTVNNLSHETAPASAVAVVVAAAPTPASAVLARRRSRQARRLRRVLRFLLSADPRRPALEDRLWTSTFEAGEAYRREMTGGVVDAARPPRRRPARPAKAPPQPAKDCLRPLSWLDHREASVKVLLFDDNSRTVGDAAWVQTERIKLLAAIADHWRLAYAHQFYLTPTDGVEQGSCGGSGSAHPSALQRGAEAATATARGTQQPQYPEGRATWECVYRRFRDANGNAQGARIRASLQRVVTAARGSGDGGAGGSPAAQHGLGSPPASRAGPIPSSGNPLFDLHLLTYTRRTQFYAAMLASTVEVPDGMGAFFATCVSESFLRWWTWRNRQRADEEAAAKEKAHSAAVALTALPTAYGAAPATLWVAQVCSVHKPQYGTTASDGSFGHRAPIEAAESIAYSSSYSDVTSSSADTLASDSSIDFVEEEEEEASDDGESVDERPHRERATTAVPSSGRDRAEGNDGVEAQEDHLDDVGERGGDATTESWPQQQQHAPASPSSCAGAPRVALLFPLPHMLAYWFMMHHVTFFNYQVYRGMWGDQEITIAVGSRILSPTGHSAECRLFYTLRCTTVPRMYTKMMFTPGTLPVLTLQDKMQARSPYRSPTSSAASSATSPSEAGAAAAPLFRTTGDRRDSDSDSSEDPAAAGTGGDADGRVPSSAAPAPSSPLSSEPRRGRYTSVDTKPVDSRQIYDLFWTGFGRVEVEVGPTISRSNLVRLRVALGLPVDYPMGLLWNVLMFASGVAPLILKDHRHSLYFNYAKSFTDVLEEEFGEVSCYGYGARPTPAAADPPMANPLDAEAAVMRERHSMAEAARAIVRDVAAVARQTQSGAAVDGGDNAEDSFSTVEPDAAATEAEASDSSSLTTSATTYGSWGLDSDFSSMGGHSSWRDWHTPYSDAL